MNITKNYRANRKNIFKIKIGKEQGTRFFCKILFPDNKNILIFFKIKSLKIYKKFEAFNTIKIDLNNRIKYTNEKFDITIIEIKKEDNIKKYLKLDEKILDEIINSINKNNNSISQREISSIIWHNRKYI